MNLHEYIKEAKNIQQKNHKISIALLSNFTTTGLSEVLKVKCAALDAPATVYEAPYNQVHQEIINDKSGLYQENQDIIFILLDTENHFQDIFYHPQRLSAKERKRFVKEQIENLTALIEKIKSKTKAKIVFNSFLIPKYTSKGILEGKGEGDLKELIYEINQALLKFSRIDNQVFIFDTNTFFQTHGHRYLTDQKMCYLGDIKLSPDGVVELAQCYVSYIYPLISKTKKCLVLDLDNTLWGGIIGEDGIENIKLGPEKEGKPFLDFQKRILDLYERGIILAINSKNNEEDALDAVKNHEYMVLREENFAAFRINWQDKATNLKELAKELNIGLDSVVFIDDDKTNRELVKKVLPQVAVVELPPDPSFYCTILEELPYFNTFSLTQDDMKRGVMYAENKKRVKVQSQAKDLKSFLKESNIVIQTRSADKHTIPRIAQLTQKTNQFNLTTKRYQEEDIEEFSNNKDYLVQSISVKDNFGDYGITGVAIIKKDGESAILDTFLLSCRVLGKEIEYSFLYHLLDVLKKDKIKVLQANFIPTKKNTPAKDFLSTAGFVESKKEFELAIGKHNKEKGIARIEIWKP